MKERHFDTLSEATNELTKEGFKENFRSGKTKIIGNNSGKEYNPEDLSIVCTCRFDGMTNPEDDSVVFALEATDGNKGTLVMSYGADQGQNVELIKKIRQTED